MGASGAISAILGAFLYLFPGARVTSLFPFLFFLPLRFPAWLTLPFWVALQWVAAGRASSGPGVAYLAHVVGFGLGFVYAWVRYRRTSAVPSLGRPPDARWNNRAGGTASRVRTSAAGPRGREPAVITAIVLIKTSVDRIPEIAESIAALDSVSEVFSVTGTYDLIAMVRVRAHDDLAEIIPGRISKIPGVEATDTHVAFRTYSQHDLEAAFAIGLDS